MTRVCTLAIALAVVALCSLQPQARPGTSPATDSSTRAKIGYVDLDQVVAESAVARAAREETRAVKDRLEEALRVGRFRDKDAAQERLNSALTHSLNVLHDQILNAIEATATDEGLAFVFSKEARLFGGVDITRAVIRRLDKLGIAGREQELAVPRPSPTSLSSATSAPPRVGTATVVFDAPIEKTQQAAIEVLTQLGWKIVEAKPHIVVGERVPTAADLRMFDPIELARKRLEWMGATPAKEPNGDTIIRGPDGTRLTESADGGRILVEPNGRRFVRLRDGSTAVDIPGVGQMGFALRVDKVSCQVWLEPVAKAQTRVSVLFANLDFIAELEKSLGKSRRE